MLTQAIKSYVEMRQACGFSFRIQSCLLRGFAKFSDKRGERFVRTSTAVEWAAGAPSTYQRARRLNTVILLSRYLRAEDTRHELPHAVFGTEKRPRRVPYIFSSEDIQRLIRAAARSGYRTLRRETYSTLFSLLACTGLRVSEAINLRYDDIGPDGLVIRCSKFKTTRLIPAHETTIAALDAYLQRRRPYAPFDDHVFISLRRKPLRLGDVDRAFRVLAERLDLRSGPGVLQPSPHSLRHTFAVRALEACPADRDHVTKHMVALSTYLGHRSAAGTYWYLQGTPHLMTDIAQRCETFVTGERT